MLSQIFQELNLKHFDGFLDEPVLKWNTRLRSSAGRFVPVKRTRARFAIWKMRVQPLQKPTIEIASYISPDLIAGVMGHEMIHYWLWARGQPFGHTPEFYEKMEAMGVPRYNPAPPPKAYQYKCGSCGVSYGARKRMKRAACAPCCKRYSKGKFDERFLLMLDATHKSD